MRRAIIERHQVVCRYHDHVREVSPHAIGWRDGRPRVIAFQFAGGSESGLPSGGAWRCFDLDGIEDPVARPGPLHGDAADLSRQSCLDRIDVAVEL